VCVTGGEDMSVTDAEKVAEEIHSRISKNAAIIWGAYIDPNLAHTIRVMLVITGVRSKQVGGRASSVERVGRDRLGIDFIR
jgi:cell division protein FtsZ